MKIKTDFVTNSSSTSFIVWGTDFKCSDLVSVVPRLVGMCGNTDFEDLAESPEDAPCEDIVDLIECAGKNSGIVASFTSSTTVWEAKHIYIGKPPNTMNNDQTLAEFKKSITDWFESVGLPKKEVRFISICWQND